MVLIATDAFKKYQSATGGVPDAATRLLTITSDQFSALQPLNFQINDVCYCLSYLYDIPDIDIQVTFTLSANAQIWPRSLNTAIGGVAGNIYLIVTDNGSNSGSGLDFIAGQTFLERFYTVYDTANQRVGFATTPYTDATTN